MIRKGLAAAGWPWIALALAVGCNEDDADPRETGVPPPPPPTSGTETGGTGSAGTTGTGGSPECGDAGCFCAASVPLGSSSRPEEEAFVCRAQCLPAGAVSLWCADDASCCEGRSCDPETGLCEASEASSTGTTSLGSSSSTGTATGAGTGTETGTTGADASGTSTGEASTGGASTGAASTGGSSTGG